MTIHFGVEDFSPTCRKLPRKKFQAQVVMLYSLPEAQLINYNKTTVIACNNSVKLIILFGPQSVFETILTLVVTGWTSTQ